MNKQEMTCELLDRTLSKLLEHYSSSQNKKVKRFEFNGKTYKKINLSTYQIENAMYEYATLEDRKHGVAIKANTLTKSPYSEMIRKAKDDMLGSRGSNLLDTGLDHAALKFNFGVLASDYKKLQEKLEFYEDIIRKAELNTALENNSSKVLLTDNTKDKTKEILSELLELLSTDLLIGMSPVKGSSPEVYYENMGTDKKLCNFSDLKDLDIELDKDNRIIRKNILRIEV